MRQNSQTYHQKVIAPTANTATSKYLDDHTLTNISYETKIKGNKALVLDGNNTIFTSGNYEFTKTKGSGGNFDKKFVITDSRVTLGDNFDADSNVDKYYGIGNEKKNKNDVNVSCFDMGDSRRVSKLELSNDADGKPTRLLSTNGLVIHTHDTYKSNGMYFKLDRGNFQIDNQSPDATAQSLKTTFLLANPGASKWVATNDDEDFLTGMYLSTGFDNGLASIEFRNGYGAKYNRGNATLEQLVGVLIEPGLQTGWGEFNNTLGGAGWQKNASLWSARDIRIENGWLYANDICFHDFNWDDPGWSNVNNGSHTLSYIFHSLNSKVNDHWSNPKDNADWSSWTNEALRRNVNTAKDAADNAQTAADNAQDTANSAYSLASTKATQDDIDAKAAELTNDYMKYIDNLYKAMVSYTSEDKNITALATRIALALQR